MLFNTDQRPRIGRKDNGRGKGSPLGGLRQRAGLAALTGLALAGLAACDAHRPIAGITGYVTNFAGAVVADEPRAVLAARDVLSTGGTAADAAVALAFTMAVTNPSSASLGGGGVCLVHDRKTGKTETLEFYAGAPSRSNPGARLASAVPGLPRGMFALHAKYGKVRWEQLLVPAENLARFGGTVSRSLAQDLALVAGPLLQDAATRRIFADAEGKVLGEGDNMTEIDLAATIGRIRLRGPGDLYAGPTSRELVEAVTAAGGSLTAEDLRDYAPRWTETVEVPFGRTTAHFAPPPAAGAVAGQMWAMILDHDRYEKQTPEARAHLLAQASMRAFADRPAWMKPDGGSTAPIRDLVATPRIERLLADYSPTQNVPVQAQGPGIAETPAATGFTVVDKEGRAVSCVLSLNNLFGIGRIAPGTGILLAAAPHPGGSGPHALAPMMVVKPTVQELTFAGTGTGGSPAAPALIGVAAGAILDGRPLEEAVAAPRVYAGLAQDLAIVEAAGQATLAEGLKGLGYTTGLINALGRVNAVSCPDGLPPRPDTCAVANDPRAFGIGMIVDGK